jgi:protein-disulfide isomerase
VVILIVAAVVGMGVIGIAVTSDLGGNDMAVAPLDMPVLNNQQELARLAQPVTLGNPDAPIKIMEFGDYQCPSCRFFQQQIKPRIDMTYIKDGHAQFVFFDFPLSIHPHSFLAARAARCAGDQGGSEPYFKYHDALFTNQPTWAISSQPARLFVDYAEAAGLDENAFETCLRSDRFADVVTANLRFAEAMDLPGTPSILVQGQGLPRRVDWGSLETIFQSISATIDTLRQGG